MPEPSSTLTPTQKTRDIIIVFGKTGTGKTEWAIREVRKRHRVLILDPQVDDEYPALVVDEIEDMVKIVDRRKVFRLRTERIDLLGDMALLAMMAGRTTLVLDEAQRYLTPRTNLEKDTPEFLDVVFRGRHTATSLMIVAQRATTVHINARSQWTRLISFRQTEPDDVDWISSQAGDKLDLPRLPIGHYYDVTPQGVVKRAIDFRASKR